jgi:hypothetical protein
MPKQMELKMSDQNLVKQKIAALISKTVANGASEAEAEAAMKVASRLASRHGLSLDDIQTGNVSTQDYINRGLGAQAKSGPMSFVATAIGLFTDCKAFALKTPRAEDRMGRLKYNSEITYFGHRVDVELAVFIHKVCEYAIDYEWRLYSSRLPVGIRKTAKSSFEIGMAQRLAERLCELKRQSMQDVDTGDTASALVVLKTELVQRAYNDLNLKPTQQTYKPQVKANPFAAGQKAGNNVSFNRGVASGAGSKTGRITQ